MDVRAAKGRKRPNLTQAFSLRTHTRTHRDQQKWLEFKPKALLFLVIKWH